MEVATNDNDIEMARGTSAAETMMASSSNNQGKSYNSMGLEHYSAAAKGDFEKFEHSDSEALAKILTPNDNTILHIHITARAPPKSSTSQVTEGDFVSKILGKCQDLLWKYNKKGESLLHMAARHGHFDVVKYLLQKYGEIPCVDDQEPEIGHTRSMLQKKSHDAKDTALHEAVQYHHLDVVKLLTKADPDLTYEANTAGETPLYLAAERGYAKVLKEIIDTCTSPADHGPYDRTALHVAVIRKDEEMVKGLVDAREGIHKIEHDQNGWTPLHFAVYLGYNEIMNKLLSGDNEMAYEADNKGKTALHVAAGHGRVDIMRELISKCPECCELIDKRGQNVLHFALESGNKMAVQLVLENPCLRNLINEKDKKGNTPFLHAASIGYYHKRHPKVEMKVLNHYGVDMQVFNHHNHNAADIVSANEHISNERYLPDLFLWVLENYEVKQGLRSENDKIGERKDEGNTVESKSKEDGVEDEGNRMSSKSNNGKANLTKKTGQTELVAATLIATVTFAAGFTVPRGFVAEKGPDQGAAILTRNKAFRAFVILNTMSFILSSLAVIYHLDATHIPYMRVLFKQMRLQQLLISYAMMAMIGAFLSGTCAVLHSDLAISTCVVPVSMFALLGLTNNVESLKLFRWKIHQKMDNFIRQNMST